MKKFTLYAFIFALLFNVWQYAFWNNEIKNQNKKIKILKQNHQTTKDSIHKLEDALYEAKYFTLERNDRALDYLEEYDLNILLPHIKEEINNLNSNPNGNPLVPMDPINGKKFVINQIQFVNNRWILADFSNSEIWGEVIIKYFINEDETIAFETAEHILHP